MKRSKAYRKADELVDATKLYSPVHAVDLARKTSTTKFDSTVEVALRLGVDPRKADQMVRGTVNLPPAPARPRECSCSRLCAS
jgi:large subunit ribosomal protein L1